MAFTVKPNGDVVCDTAEEAVALAQRLRAPAPGPAVGESIPTTRWHEIHAHDKRMAAQVEKLKALAPFFDCLTPLQRQCCELRVTGKWPAEIAKELGRTTGTIQAIIWDAKKRLVRRERGDQSEPTAAPPPAPAAPAPEPPPAPSCEPPLPDPAKAARRCGKCGGTGHNARTCPGVAPEAEIIPSPVTDGEPTKPQKNIPKDIPVGPRLYVVSEDFEEEDGTAWIEGDVWEAIEPTGESVEEAEQWRMQRAGDGAEGIGFPGLHPFVPHDARASGRPLDRVTVPRVGMGLRAMSATV